MVVKVYGMGVSTCTKRVFMTCHELGIKYELNHIDLLKGEHKNPEYIANMQPFGSIPVLIYGKDSTLVPSPTDPKAYGLFEQAASIEYSSFDPTASGVYLEKVHARIEGREPDIALVEKSRQALLAKFEVG
ncbi:unnamed protein product [Rhizoctonia solani]|uniref:glutathione transferase n=1 Tax=Rhizoctonia solani TaxID=456999 RepID=A0A8H2WIF8_9AGAM|nr:unnamed protein product [Rhizoctonia solani]